MSDDLFRNKETESENNNLNVDSSTGSNQENKEPPSENLTNSTYSFWAEQIAASSSDFGRQSKDISDQKQMNETQTNETQMNDTHQLDDNSYYNYSNQNNQNNHIFDMSSANKTKSSPPKKKFMGKAVKFIFGAAVFGIIASGSFIGFNVVYYNLNPNATPITIQLGNNNGTYGGYKLNLNPPTEDDKKIAATTVSQETIEQKTDITDVVESTMPSIVTITTTYTQSYYDWFGQQVDQENEGGGSGIIVGKNETELLIATNNHVVEGADPITVKFIDGTQAQAIIKGTDAVADLAVISIDIETIEEDTLKAIEIAVLGDSDSVKVGQMAIAIGNALGYGQSTTVGYISAKEREVVLEDKAMVLLQTDAAINPGNSGGALLNIKGEVIGINTVKYASSEVEGMGFAIPISRAMPIIDELMNREVLADNEKGYLGVYINDVTEDIANMYNWPIGVYVTETVEDGSADMAGIVAGDIITKVNDTEVTASTQLKEKVTSYRAGTDITITVMRSVSGTFVEKQIIVNLTGYPEIQEN